LRKFLEKHFAQYFRCDAYKRRKRFLTVYYHFSLNIHLTVGKVVLLICRFRRNATIMQSSLRERKTLTKRLERKSSQQPRDVTNTTKSSKSSALR